MAKGDNINLKPDWYILLKKTLKPFFIDGVQLPQRHRPIRGESLLFTSLFPRVLGTHLIDLGRRKAELTLEPPSSFEPCSFRAISCMEI